VKQYARSHLAHGVGHRGSYSDRGVHDHIGEAARPISIAMLALPHATEAVQVASVYLAIEKNAAIIGSADLWRDLTFFMTRLLPATGYFSGSEELQRTSVTYCLQLRVIVAGFPHTGIPLSG
jgi:hypothetical protein